MASFRQSVRELLRFIIANGTSLQRSMSASSLAYKEADDRAFKLLLDNLSGAQREQYEMRGYLEVIGGHSGKRYRIRRGHQLNVEEPDQKGRRLRLLCFMPKGHHPIGDVMLAQKIALEVFERDALKIANRSPAWDFVVSGDLWIGRRYRHR